MKTVEAPRTLTLLDIPVPPTAHRLYGDMVEGRGPGKAFALQTVENRQDSQMRSGRLLLFNNRSSYKPSSADTASWFPGRVIILLFEKIEEYTLLSSSAIRHWSDQYTSNRHARQRSVGFSYHTARKPPSFRAGMVCVSYCLYVPSFAVPEPC